MEKKLSKPIPTFTLNERYFHIHKHHTTDSGFGLDHTSEIIDNGFALYSCEGTKTKLGPLRSNFYRIAFCFKGSLQVDIGLESFVHGENTIHFNIPDRLFAFKNKSEDIKAYYLQFTADFIDEVLSADLIKKLYPFFDYAQVPFFKLNAREAKRIKKLFEKISEEIHADTTDRSRAIKLLLNLIMIESKRSYVRQGLQLMVHDKNDSRLLRRFKKEVSQHFITMRTVREYAQRLAISPNHLNKVVKKETGKSAGELIDEMLIMEIKSLLKYTELTISEIAYQMDFTDTSHFSKFFKRYTGRTPLDYHKKSS